MFKSVKKLYELDRTFDYSKEGSLNKRKFVKHRAHKRLRKQLNVNKETQNENME